MNKKLLIFVFVIQVIEILYSIQVSSWMADESAWHFFGILCDELVAFHSERIGALAIYRLPTWVLCHYLGVVDFQILKTIYGISLYVTWPACFVICYTLCKRTNLNAILLPTLSYAIGSVNVGLFTASESHFMHAMFWIVAFSLLFYQRTIWRQILLFVSFCFFCFSYGGTSVLGCVLFFICLYKLRQSNWKDLVLVAATLVAILSSAYGFYAVTIKESLALNALGGFINAFNGRPFHWNLILCIIVYVVVLIFVLQKNVIAKLFLTGVLYLLAVTLGSINMLFPGEIQPDIAGYFVRSLNTFVPVFMIGLLLLYKTKPSFQQNITALSSPLLTVWLGQILFMFTLSYQFNEYINFMRQYAHEHPGISTVSTPYFNTKIKYNEDEKDILRKKLVNNIPVYSFSSMWIAIPAQSLLYSDNNEIRSLLAPEIGLLPEYSWAFTTTPGKAQLLKYGFDASYLQQSIP